MREKAGVLSVRQGQNPRKKPTLQAQEVHQQEQGGELEAETATRALRAPKSQSPGCGERGRRYSPQAQRR